jgi:peroxiredoxin
MKYLAVLLLFTSLFAQAGHDNSPKVETKDGKVLSLDFGIPLKGISDPSLSLSQFAKEDLVIFYFSAKCPHCMRAFPEMQKIYDRFSSQGLKMIAIASGYNKRQDIHTFIANQKVQVPVLQDRTKEFGKKYGVGSVPLVVLTNPKGEFIKYKHFDHEKVSIKQELENRFGMIFK